ncbi:MAG: hypothetical protein CMO80_13335 [Verrucomicrobiales bacterium]|nr:hypothetical protein [Verrucomicrobiales bacterium]
MTLSERFWRLLIAAVALAVSTSLSAEQLEDSVIDFAEAWCTGCHSSDEKKGGLDLENILEHDMAKHSATWELVVRRLGARQMPPPNRKRRPNEKQYDRAISALVARLDARAKADPKPGRVPTFRRLTRTEYQNSIRDLLGVQIDAAALLPQDEESHGFDNITVGTLSPVLVDRYITAARKISRLAVGSPLKRPDGATFRVPATYTQEKHVPGLPIGTRGGLVVPYNFPVDGEYEIEVRLMRDRNEKVEGLRGQHKIDVLLDRALVRQFSVKPQRDHDKIDQHLKVKTFVKAGPRKVGAAFHQKSQSLLENKRQPFEASFNFHRHPRKNPAVYYVSITGPFTSTGVGATPSRRKIFISRPENGLDEEQVAEAVLANLMKRAYRRAIAKADLQQPMAFYRGGAKEGGFDKGIESALSAILVNPAFLFRVERDPSDSSKNAYRISDLELASRLSFFLWSSLPDDELLDLAIANQLRDEGVLGKQVRRMLADERSSNLVNNFANQWLHLRNLDSSTPDLRLFPDFDENLRRAFRQETEMFIESVLREDRSVLDLLNANYTYLNGRLARHYDIPGIFGSRFRRVALDPEHRRGGLLRHGSILTVTSYATRTSPVIRGNWVLDNFIGTPPKPPPPDVPALEDNKVDARLPIRDRLAEHRKNPACASCHDAMDPVGFALENYDAVGRWRKFESGREIDSSGGLPDGQVFDGVEKLEAGLLQRPELFVRTLSEKLLVFALGRGVEPYDASAIRRIVHEAKADDFRFSSVILGIAKSVPFQMRARANGEKVAGK